VVGGVVAFGLIHTLYPGVTPDEAADILVPHLRGEGDPETGQFRPAHQQEPSTP
jgi:hypothetical protein